MFHFLFKKKEDEETKFARPSIKQEVFLVVHKTTGAMLGVFDTLEKAKEIGRKTTYCTCQIYRFTVNDKCNYLINPVYEDA